MIQSISIKKGKLTLPLICRGFGLNHIQEPVNRAKGLPYYQFFYCKKGNGELNINGQQMMVFEGQSMLLFPNENHSYHGLDDEWILDYVMISGPAIDSTISSLGHYESAVFNLATNQFFEKFITYLMDYDSDVQSEALQHLSKETYAFIIDFAANATRIDNRKAATQNPKISAVIEYMETHYSETISLDDLAREVELSKEYLCNVFKAEMNTTIISFLNNIRIGNAKMHLKEYPFMSVAEIAKKCGFESSSYFGKIFKQSVGVTPAVFRK